MRSASAALLFITFLIASLSFPSAEERDCLIVLLSLVFNRGTAGRNEDIQALVEQKVCLVLELRIRIVFLNDCVCLLFGFPLRIRQSLRNQTFIDLICLFLQILMVFL